MMAGLQSRGFSHHGPPDEVLVTAIDVKQLLDPFEFSVIWFLVVLG
jgi:hypothetical protein